MRSGICATGRFSGTMRSGLLCSRYIKHRFGYLFVTGKSLACCVIMISRVVMILFILITSSLDLVLIL